MGATLKLFLMAIPLKVEEDILAICFAQDSLTGTSSIISHTLRISTEHNYYLRLRATLDSFLSCCMSLISRPVAELTSQFLGDRSHCLRGRSVVELGCGLGLCGIIAGN